MQVWRVEGCGSLEFYTAPRRLLHFKFRGFAPFVKRLDFIFGFPSISQAVLHFHTHDRVWQIGAGLTTFGFLIFAVYYGFSVLLNSLSNCGIS